VAIPVTYTYDCENHMIKLETSTGTTQFVYDTDGSRIKKTAYSLELRVESETTYVNNLYEIRTSNGETETIKHIFAGANRVCTITTPGVAEGLPGGGVGTVAYYHSDHLGSSNVITDETGAQVSLTEYTPYGTPIVDPTSSFSTPYKFTGKELDSTGLYFYAWRYYDPELGRFCQPDTIIPQPYNPQTLNRYSYCDNNPLNYTDPSGHNWWKNLISQIVGAVVGAVVGTLTGNPALGWAVYSGISSGMTAAMNGGNIGQALGIGFAAGITSFIGGQIGGGLGGALGLGRVGTSMLAGAFGGAAGGATGTALGGGDIGRGALAGFLGGSIGGLGAGIGGPAVIIGNMLGGGVSSEVAGGNFVAGAIGGAMYTIGSAIGQAIMSGNLQRVAMGQRVGQLGNNDAFDVRSFAERHPGLCRTLYYVARGMLMGENASTIMQWKEALEYVRDTKMGADRAFDQYNYDMGRYNHVMDDGGLTADQLTTLQNANEKLIEMKNYHEQSR